MVFKRLDVMVHSHSIIFSKAYARITGNEPETESKNEFGIHVLASGENPIVDIIAIHGLYGHLMESWTAENGILWLRGLLPEIVPHARILTYGYPSRTRGRGQLESESIHDLAKDLVSSIAAERRISGIERRPIIFVAHSIGGIILKSVLLLANCASSVHNPHHKAVEISTHGVLFLGTPHQGGERVNMVLLLLHIQSICYKTNNGILSDLRLNSKILQEQLGRYAAISHKYITKFIYEVYPTKLFTGQSIKLVDQYSAVVPGTQNAESVALKKDHFGIAKFSHSSDWDFRTLASHLSCIAEEAPSKVVKNWDRYERHEELDRIIESGKMDNTICTSQILNHSLS